MIEKTLLDYLDAVLPVPVFAEAPEEKPARFCVIRKTNGSMQNRIRHATVAVQSYAESLYEAAELNERVIEAMDGAAALPEVAGVGLSGDYPFPDLDTKKYRWQAVFILTHY